MKSTNTSVSLALLIVVAIAPVYAPRAAEIVHKEPLAQLRMTGVAQPVQQKNTGTQFQSLGFDALGRRFEIELEPNRTLIDAAERLQLGRRVGIYRGRIAGSDGSWARIVVEDGLPRGMFSDGGDIWAIELLPNDRTGLLEPQVFRLADLYIAPGTLGCAHINAAATGAQLAQALLAESSLTIQRAAGATLELDVAVIGDSQFTAAKGAGAEAALVTRMNNVDGIFSAQLGVQINVTRIDTFASANDPFSNETDSAALLGELTDYRFASPVQKANGLTHLFTGRNLDGTTVGIAYTSALCSSHFGAGLTQGTHSVTVDSLIAAHEIGHNFGAPHDGTSGSACSAESQSFLMAPSINGSDQFSACSVTEMENVVAGSACIAPIASTDIEVVAAAQSGPVLLGNSASFTLEANSIGTSSASDVTVDIAIPSGVDVLDVTASGGACTTGAGVASCLIQTIPSGSGSTIQMTVQPTAVATVDFIASATATVDDDSTNNQVTVSVMTNPAVDVVAVAAASAQVTASETVLVQAIVENLATIAATNVSATVTPGAGIVLLNASWPAGACSISSNVATCQAGSLAPQSSTVLALGFTGSIEGLHSYVVTVTPAEIDRVVTNNAATGQVSVNPAAPPAPPPSASVPPATSGAEAGGGGSFGLPSVLLLLLAELIQRTRRNRRAYGSRN